MRDRDQDARSRRAEEMLREYEISRRRVLEALGVGAGAAASGLLGRGHASAAVSPSGASGSADIVLHSGAIWTGVLGSNQQAVAIKDQRVVAVGSNREVLPWAGATTRSIDLRGAFVKPGFRDQ